MSTNREFGAGKVAQLEEGGQISFRPFPQFAFSIISRSWKVSAVLGSLNERGLHR